MPSGDDDATVARAALPGLRDFVDDVLDGVLDSFLGDFLDDFLGDALVTRAFLDCFTLIDLWS